VIQKIYFPVLCLAVLICSISSVQALPTIGGTSGLVRMPTAQGLKYKEFNLGFDYISQQTVSGSSRMLYKANLGTLDGLEIGFVGQGQQEGVFINLKYYLLSDNTEQPLMMALGIDNISSFNKTDIYMVASKIFKGGFSMHLGFLAPLQGTATNPSLMLGTEYYFSESLSLAMDTVGQSSIYDLAAGLRFRTSQNLIFSIHGNHLLAPVNAVNPAEFGVGITFTDFI
jgi:hypothetical protein